MGAAAGSADAESGGVFAEDQGDFAGLFQLKHEPSLCGQHALKLNGSQQISAERGAAGVVGVVGRRWAGWVDEHV